MWSSFCARLLIKMWYILILYDTCYYSNFGKLNYYLGAGAEKDGRPAKYPQLDFCKFDVFFSVHGVGPNPNISFPAHSSLHHYMLIVWLWSNRQGPRSDLRKPWVQGAEVDRRWVCTCHCLMCLIAYSQDPRNSIKTRMQFSCRGVLLDGERTIIQRRRLGLYNRASQVCGGRNDWNGVHRWCQWHCEQRLS